MKKIPAVPRQLLPLLLLAAVLPVVFLAGQVQAQPLPVLPSLSIDIGGAEDGAGLVPTLQLLLLLTVLSLVPAILVLMTSFTRVVIVLGFVRSAIGTQQVPPNQIIAGLALFLTLFIMSPVFVQINETALQPYLAEQITQEEAYASAMAPLREFMFRQTRERDLALFVSVAGMERPAGREDIPLPVLIPAFVISELKTAFQMGFLLFVPFLIIDMVVASTLMAMGMFMLPPVLISLPFKLLLLIMVDGWHLVVRSLVESFV